MAVLCPTVKYPEVRDGRSSDWTLTHYSTVCDKRLRLSLFAINNGLSTLELDLHHSNYAGPTWLCSCWSLQKSHPESLGASLCVSVPP